MKQNRPGRGAEQYPLRLPEGMRDDLKKAAEKNGRSLNAEIVQRLEASLAGADGPGDPIDQIFVEAMKKFIDDGGEASRTGPYKLTFAYEEYKGEKLRHLRRFIDLIYEITESGEDIYSRQQFEIQTRREVAATRNWLRSIGLDIVKTDDRGDLYFGNDAAD